MPVTALRERAAFGDMTGSIPYWGPAATGRPVPRPAATAPGLTPLAVAREALRARPARAA